ncbi:MAG: type IVB secretion system protein DotA, partial [Gammaproteobacteria bacterium]|nr:type IVB secretion system protein DotA [Gammaproteobacteria bacterium]
MSVRWKCFVLTMLSFFPPALALADTSSSISFVPPASDISVTFLGNLFGMVDGVLHGTGSQIMGAMFGVFNAAVLALGGIVVMYIILVSTMNTAHEGQMLGQKWSSIWVPVRATIGLSFLIPKASGYCLMQIFVMWVVLQGVGVADKIWGTALGYLNSGGVIIQANMAPDISMGAANSEIIQGAANMLYGQVCMAGLQKQLEALRTNYLAAKEKGSGQCSGTPSTTMAAFCEQSVPNFADTVSPLTAYNEQHKPSSTTQETFAISMPSITDSNSIYASLTGICGTINWNGLPPDDVSSVTSTIASTSAESIQASRAAAVEQMYLDLLTTAKIMVNNDPQINPDSATDDETSAVAVSQFGVAQTADGVTCTSLGDACPNWGADSVISTPVLLEGTELQDAVADYNAIMASTLNLMGSASDGDTATKERAFISTAEKYGWIMAGSYFFDLALLNGSAASSTTTDSDTGLSNSSFNVSLLTDAFSSSACDGTYAALCDFFTINNMTPIDNLVTLINGQGLNGMTALSATDFSQGMTGYGGVASSTVYGYAANAALIDLPGQEGAAVTID